MNLRTNDQRIYKVRECKAHYGKLTPQSGASLRTPMRANTYLKAIRTQRVDECMCNATVFALALIANLMSCSTRVLGSDRERYAVISSALTQCERQPRVAWRLGRRNS